MAICNKLILTDLLQLDEIDKFVAQAGKIYNLQQVCGVLGCVNEYK